MRWSAAQGNDEGRFQLPLHRAVFPGTECWGRRVRWVRVPLGSYPIGAGGTWTCHESSQPLSSGHFLFLSLLCLPSGFCGCCALK